MKKVLLSCALLSSIVLISCEKLKDAVFPSFDTTIAEVVVTLPAVSNTSSELSLNGQLDNVNVDSIIRNYTNNQFNLDNSESVKVLSVKMELLNGDDQNNFSNFEHLSFSVANNSKPNPVEVASTTISEAVNPLVISGKDVDLTEYLKESPLKYSIKSKARKATTKPLQISLAVEVRIN